VEAVDFEVGSVVSAIEAIVVSLIVVFYAIIGFSIAARWEEWRK
jgi:hypothetical protein